MRAGVRGLRGVRRPPTRARLHVAGMLRPDPDMGGDAAAPSVPYAVTSYQGARGAILDCELPVRGVTRDAVATTRPATPATRPPRRRPTTAVPCRVPHTRRPRSDPARVRRDGDERLHP